VSDDTAILQLMQTPGIGSKTLTRLFVRLAGERRPVEDVLDAPREELIRHYALRAETADAISAAREEAATLASVLGEHGVRVLSVMMPEYPVELKEALKVE
jgi:predicted Rossmann fold nucleotide-binding protein DprA/Smf involved in DNA uptake